MMTKFFDEHMSYSEAQTVLFSVVVGKTKEEKERIKAEYSAILPAIIHKETMANKNCLTEVLL